MSKQWHKGPPPSIGWWPASKWRDPSALRWWDGRRWSLLARRGWLLGDVTFVAGFPDCEPDEIEWTERPKWWPKRSRT